jgi:DNA-binding IclR family transcriptional regulator
VLRFWLYVAAMSKTSAASAQTGPRSTSGTNMSVQRALGVLTLFAEHGPVLRVGEVARLCGLGASTASRLLATLVDADLLERDTTGSYQLGSAVITLAGVALNRSSLYREARTVAYEISTDTGLGVNVAELRDGKVFYLLHFDGRLAPRSYTLMGRRNPLHATGLGKCLLADLSPDERLRLVGAGPFDSYTAHTLTDPASLDEHLRLVGARGYATEREELALSRACVAAPIRGRGNAVVAAISISGPLSALRLEDREPELSRMVIEAADRIGAAVGAVHASPTDKQGVIQT